MKHEVADYACAMNNLSRKNNLRRNAFVVHEKHHKNSIPCMVPPNKECSGTKLPCINNQKRRTTLPSPTDDTKIQIKLPLLREHITDETRAPVVNNCSRYLVMRRNGLGVLPLRERRSRNQTIETINVETDCRQYEDAPHRTDGVRRRFHLCILI